MRVFLILLLSVISSFSQVTKEVRYFNLSGVIQQPTNFFSVNIRAGTNVVFETNTSGQLTISGSSSGGGGGDVTTAQLLVVSNQLNVASNKFNTDITNLQALVITSGAIDMDFGAAPGSDIATTVITGQTTIKTNSYIIVRKMAIATSDHSDFDAVVTDMDVMSTGPTAGTGFTIYAMSRMGRLTGKYRIHWSWFN
jgi:hypothetical protein